jgi:hypothetical protein
MTKEGVLLQEMPDNYESKIISQKNMQKLQVSKAKRQALRDLH